MSEPHDPVTGIHDHGTVSLADQWCGAPEERASLAKKMVQVQEQIERMPKTGENKAQRYRFVEEGAIADFIRPRLAKAGIALFTSQVWYRKVVVGETSSGNDIWNALCLAELEYVDTDTGASRKCYCFGEANDSGDKSINKAFTAAVKYSLMKTFLISTGEDDTERESEAGDGNFRGRAQRSSGRSGGAVAKGVKCGSCGGAVYDNRQAKARGEFQRSPDLVCRDKDGCGWTWNEESAA